MVRYSEDPAVQVEAHVSAPLAVVWPLVSDITLPARFSTGLVAAEWIDGGGPRTGARFTGRSHHHAIGTWQVTCTVAVCAQMIELAGEVSREPAM